MFKQIKILTVIFFLFTIASCNMNYLDYYQHIESPDGKYNYGLYSDFSIGDPGFLVLKLEKGINPKELKIDYILKTVYNMTFIHKIFIFAKNKFYDKNKFYSRKSR